MDLILAGGGLSNGLLAARLVETRPELELVVLEAGPALGGNHTWSFHESDVPAEALPWLHRLGARSFPGGHDVLLPGLTRTLEGTYWTLRSTDFAAKLTQLLGHRVRLQTRVAEVGATHVQLDSGERLDATAVIDARAVMPQWPCGWQKFLGQELVLSRPHGLRRPVLMDATVEQHDGFRFVYALPFDERRVLVEDTVYSNGRELDLSDSRARIASWCRARGFEVERVEREEHAALPIPLSGRTPRFDRPMLGVAAGFFHATTGYSLPTALRLAWRVAQAPLESLTAMLQREATAHWRSQSFYRLLNRMLFLAAEPSERVRVFASFYRHDEDVIERFYAGALRFSDVLAVLRRGSSTVPVLRAAAAAL